MILLPELGSRKLLWFPCRLGLFDETERWDTNEGVGSCITSTLGDLRLLLVKTKKYVSKSYTYKTKLKVNNSYFSNPCINIIMTLSQN